MTGEPAGTHNVTSLDALRRPAGNEDPAVFADSGLALREARRFDEAIVVYQEAIAAFRRAADRQREAMTLNNLGIALREVRRIDEAIAAHQEAIATFRRAADRQREGVTLNNLGIALREVRRIDEAIAAHQEALKIFRDTNDRYHETGVLNNLGIALRDLGRFDEAIAALQEAVIGFRRVGDRHHEGLAFSNLGMSLHDLGRFDEAIAADQQAIEIFRWVGDRYHESTTLNNLGISLRIEGRLEEAIAAHQNAAENFRHTGDRHHEGVTLDNLGVALCAASRFDEAITAHQEAAVVFRGISDRYLEGITLGNLGLAQQRAGRPLAAVTVAQESVAAFTETGDRRDEGRALNRLGAALYETGQIDEAIAAHRNAANAFQEVADSKGIERALDYLHFTESARAKRQSEAKISAAKEVTTPDRDPPRTGRPQDESGGGIGDTGGSSGNGTEGDDARRYLMGRLPGSVRPEQVFSVLVSVIYSVGPPADGSAPLKPFLVPKAGQIITLIIDAPGLRVLDDHRQAVLVPSNGNSEPVKFDLVSDDPGPRRISITAWDGGSFLGELAVEISVERDGPMNVNRTVVSPAREERTDGEVTLLVRYDPHQNAYRFEFIDVDYPDEVTSQLVYDPGPVVERLIRRLNALAEGTAGYSATATRTYLINEGVQLWQELIPQQLRSQFWERQERIKQLTILANHDVVPWELLYPKDRSRDAGFLVNQFPVTRAVYGRTQERRLRLYPARFVIPSGSPVDARAEAETLARLLGTKLNAVSDLMPLLKLISRGRFGLLHFACHNRFDSEDGSSIRLDSPFTPTFLTTAASDQTLANAGPVVFINACRSLGQVPSYNRLDGWASKFMHAGAAAFIGSLWEVSDGAAREFAQELYSHLLEGDPLGRAVMAARHAISDEPGDPTWLAYAVYGDPQARIDRSTTPDRGSST